LAINAVNFPKKTALILEQERYSYAQLNEESNRMANALLALEAEEGLRVAVLEKTTHHPNSGGRVQRRHFRP
jgi:acyl-CoA synthetase (AMP-forming)/AMP-acid ligase II